MRKDQLFIPGYEGQVERLCCKAFQQTEASPPTEHALVFLRWEKLLPGSDGELTGQPLACPVPTICTNIDENQIPSPHHGVWGGH